MSWKGFSDWFGGDDGFDEKEYKSWLGKWGTYKPPEIKQIPWDKILTEPPSNYIPASPKLIKKWMRDGRVGDTWITKYLSPELVHDTANLLAGGRVYKEQADSDRGKILVEARNGMAEVVRGSAVTCAVELLSDVAKKLIFKYGDKKAEEMMQGGLENSPELRELFQIAMENNNNMNQQMDSDDQKLLDQEEEKTIDGSSPTVDESKHLMPMTRINGDAFKVWNAMHRVMKRFSPFVVSKETIEIRDPDGSDRRIKPMTSPADVARMSTSEFAYPKEVIAARIGMMAPVVRETISTKTRKRLCFVLMDISGSMEQYNRLQMAKGVAYSRIKSAIDGDAETHIIAYNHDIARVLTPAVDLPSCKKAVRELMNIGADGGTDTQNVILNVLERVRKLYEENSDGLVRPEIVVVGDATDGVDDTIDTHGTRIHSIMVNPPMGSGTSKDDTSWFEDNMGIGKLAKKTGGQSVPLFYGSYGDMDDAF